ncbi:MAG: ATP-binding cassette domain-containing protein [Bryobacterales bacterium]|nr:ATP-binding cassette domain-containing protein [Bryobacteraceae bacterium]MDW8353878.1 ATP-binding cassette domain-containing protein [Bryobacterales bacterium]
MLELQGVSKRYDSGFALHGTDLTIAAEQTTILLGPSGCGKSTLLRLMMGLVWPDTGRVLLSGLELTPRNVRAIRRRIGYVIQDGGLFPHLTARDNVTLMAQYLGWERQRIHERLARLVELTQFPWDRLDQFPAQLSGGQRQRVALMRALMLDPDVVLLDEPLGALDPMIRSELQNDLRDIFRTLRKTVVLVTHDLGEAAFFADRIVLMREGRIIQQGTLRDLLDSPAEPFVTQFIRAQRRPWETSPE